MSWLQLRQQVLERVLAVYCLFTILAILATFSVIGESSVVLTGQTETEDTDSPNVKTVTIVQGARNPDNGQFYNPPTITVEPQTKIIWKNEDVVREDEIISEVQHTAVSGERGRPDPSHGESMIPDGIFDTGFILQGQSSLPTEMPSTPGVYPYFCILHPFMNGTVIVK